MSMKRWGTIQLSVHFKSCCPKLIVFIETLVKSAITNTTGEEEKKKTKNGSSFQTIFVVSKSITKKPDVWFLALFTWRHFQVICKDIRSNYKKNEVDVLHEIVESFGEDIQINKGRHSLSFLSNSLASSSWYIVIVKSLQKC
ncbi:hypothetical protein Glove_208g145 [Diversispora epigaea]|uniref:Uncharacterized protein n=1 Tax=Diversispora epigaea TaxID=1348612 RepID=A0A397IS26_9GLOM|nr:hypothetical protein Glove_208g145 [Diversispora epigaea]